MVEQQIQALQAELAACGIASVVETRPRLAKPHREGPPVVVAVRWWIRLASAQEIDLTMLALVCHRYGVGTVHLDGSEIRLL